MSPYNRLIDKSIQITVITQNTTVFRVENLNILHFSHY